MSYPSYSIVLALHVVGFIVWCAGLFYWIRIMVYQSEAVEQQNKHMEAVLLQLQIMSERLYRIIIIPGMILTWTMGLILMVMIEAWQFGWFHLKLTLLVLLSVYQFYGQYLMGNYRHYYHYYRSYHNSEDTNLKSKITSSSVSKSSFMRMYNEVATLLIVGIVFAVILRDFSLIALLYAGFIVFLVLGFMGYRIFYRKKTADQSSN